MKKILTVLIVCAVMLSVFAGRVVSKTDITNGCGKWEEMNNGLYGGYVESLAINPNNTNVIYAGTYGGVFKSTNGGETWKKMNNGLTNTYVESLAINPNNTNVIYAGTYGGGVFKSTNGGSRWKKINNGLTDTHVYSLAIDPNNTNIIYTGTWGGVFKSTNGGESWKKINNGLTYTAVRSLAIDPKNTNIIYAGIWGGVFKSTNGGESWNKMNNGLMGGQIKPIAIDPNNTNVIYTGIIYGGGAFKSTNSGESWKNIDIGLADTSVQSLAIDPNNTNIIYAGTPSGVFKSTNGGESWKMMNNGLTDTRIESLAIDPNNTNIIYAGTYGGGVFKYVSCPFEITTESLSEGKAKISYSATLSATNGASPYIWTVVSGSLPPGLSLNSATGEISGIPTSAGSYTFTIQAKDSSNKTATKDYSITINPPPQYSITASSGLNGSIYPSGVITVNYGDSKTFTIAPDMGYKISDVIVDGESVGAVSSYTFTDVISNHIISVTFEKNTIKIILQINNPYMDVNGEEREIDPGRGTTPIIKNNRTLVPIRAIVEALGGTIQWNPTTKGITITLNNTTIILQIDNSFAYVNGIQKQIDPSNPKVVPIIINGRTMLPLRFVAENLGCQVAWEPKTKTITLIYENEG